MARSPLVVNVLDLLRQPGHRRAVDTEIPISDLGVDDGRLRPGAIVEVRLLLDSLTDGLTVSGRISVPWFAECRRCLTPLERVAVSTVTEAAAVQPSDEDILPIVGDQLDLEPIVREAILLELPLAPLCRPECQGLCSVCGADRNETACGHDDKPIDPRWSVLGDLFANPDS